MRVICSFALTLLVSITWADSPDAKEPVPEPVSSELSFIDEVIVVENKNVSQLRVELRKADDQLFSLYNALNTDDSLDMICKKETRIGSQIKYRVCKSSYHRELESESASEFLEGGSVATPSIAPSDHYAKVRSNMSTLIAEHPELKRAFYKRAVLRKKIAEQKNSR